MKKFLTINVAAAVLAALVGMSLVAYAAAPQGSFGTLNQRTALPAVQTLTAVGPSTVTSADQGGYGSAVMCVYTQTAHTGSNSVLFSIEGKFGTAYVSLLTSAAITTDVSTPISVGPGVATTANVGSGVPLPALWRTKIVESGGGSTVTGRVDCSLD